MISIADLDLDHFLDDNSNSTVEIQNNVQELNDQSQDEMDAQISKQDYKEECNNCFIQNQHEM